MKPERESEILWGRLQRAGDENAEHKKVRREVAAQLLDRSNLVDWGAGGVFAKGGASNEELAAKLLEGLEADG